ncbi:unnamed protein product [Moneuplotes crassus]|uniref:Flap endonuclease 1 n=1 Tax=Euplotes crassus TaxID=5936 RepID=A0AAD1XC40_EUPCR|nr:unnamed protein product [Moneuplotes crassus]
MGIKNLMPLLNKKAPQAIYSRQYKDLQSQTVAIDATMAMYQFLISTISLNKKRQIKILEDSEGNRTGHLIGILHRTNKILSHGIKPVWIFDGPSPLEKKELIDHRQSRVECAQQRLEQAQEDKDVELEKKMSERVVRINKTHRKDAKLMLKYMGIPAFESPSEAEAQCCELVKAGVARGVVSEDLDCLAFGAKSLIRGMKSSKNFTEIMLEDILSSLNLSMSQFIDVCILLGCDYLPKPQNIGPVTAFSFIQKYENIESIVNDLENINKKRKRKIVITDANDTEQDCIKKIEHVRGLFTHPNVARAADVDTKFHSPQPEKLLDFLVTQKQFKAKNVMTAVKKMEKSLSKYF